MKYTLSNEGNDEETRYKTTQIKVNNSEINKRKRKTRQSM